MSPIKDLTDLAEKLITEHGSAAILREHLALLRAKADAVAQENVKLQEELADAKKVIRALTSQLETKTRAEEFIEHRGVLFKRRTEGGYHKVPYCPNCRTALASMEGVLPYSCRCHFHADFTGSQLAAVMAELP